MQQSETMMVRIQNGRSKLKIFSYMDLLLDRFTIIYKIYRDIITSTIHPYACFCLSCMHLLMLTCPCYPLSMWEKTFQTPVTDGSGQSALIQSHYCWLLLHPIYIATKKSDVHVWMESSHWLQLLLNSSRDHTHYTTPDMIEVDARPSIQTSCSVVTAKTKVYKALPQAASSFYHQ